MSSNRHIYLISNGFQGEYEIAFANGLYAIWQNLTLVAGDRTLVARARRGLPIVNWRGSQSEKRSAFAKGCNLFMYWSRLIYAMRREPDAVFHFNGLFALRNPLGNLIEAISTWLICRHWWLSIHNIVPHDRDSRLRRLVNRIIYRLPQRLVVHTPRMKDKLVHEWGIPPERVLCIRHGIDRAIEANAAEVARVQARYGVQSVGRPLLLCFGNIAPYKGADLMLQALPLANCNTEVSVLILGRMRDQVFFQQLKTLASQQCPGASVQVIDAYVDDDDLPGILAGASAMVLPYRHIDQSGVLFTARAAGLPVIATPVGSLAEELVSGFDELAPDITPTGLAGALDAWFARQPRQANNAMPTRSQTIESLLWQHTLLPYRDALKLY